MSISTKCLEMGINSSVASLRKNIHSLERENVALRKQLTENKLTSNGSKSKSASIGSKSKSASISSKSKSASNGSKSKSKSLSLY